MCVSAQRALRDRSAPVRPSSVRTLAASCVSPLHVSCTRLVSRQDGDGELSMEEWVAYVVSTAAEEGVDDVARGMSDMLAQLGTHLVADMGLSPGELAALGALSAEVFQMIDADGSGSLDTAEASLVFGDDEQWEYILEEADTDGDGELSLREWQAYMLRMAKVDGVEDAIEALTTMKTEVLERTPRGVVRRPSAAAPGAVERVEARLVVAARVKRASLFSDDDEGAAAATAAANARSFALHVGEEEAAPQNTVVLRVEQPLAQPLAQPPLKGRGRAAMLKKLAGDHELKTDDAAAADAAAAAASDARDSQRYGRARGGSSMRRIRGSRSMSQSFGGARRRAEEECRRRRGEGRRRRGGGGGRERKKILEPPH